MSDTKVKISQLPAVSEVLGTDESPSVQSSTTKKFSMSQLGTYILSSFSGLSLGGALQTAKAAIDAVTTALSNLSALVGNTAMGTTATTVTGAIAEHESDIISLNSSLSGIGVAFKTGTITIPDGTSAVQRVTIDVSDVLPSGKSLYGAMVTLANYELPYVSTANYQVATWISYIGSHAVSIDNKTSAWSNYRYYMVVFYH